MKRETYNILVEVRDENHKVILDKDGNKCLDIKFDLSFERENAEHCLRQIAKNLVGWMPNYNINIGASLLSKNGSDHPSLHTWTTMFSLYVNENRFIVH